MKNEGPTFTITLSAFLDLAWWNEDQRQLPSTCYKYAEIVEALCVDKQLCHVEFFGKKATIWKYGVWKNLQEEYEKRKKQSEEERKERFIFQANMEVVLKKLKRSDFAIEGERAIATASTMIRKKQMGKLLLIGVDELIERIEDVE